MTYTDTKYTRLELIKFINLRGIVGCSRKNKQELIELLVAIDNPKPMTRIESLCNDFTRVEDLKLSLRILGLSTVGLKYKLVARIVYYTINQLTKISSNSNLKEDKSKIRPDLPPEVLEYILLFLNYDEIGNFETSRYFWKEKLKFDFPDYKNIEEDIEEDIEQKNGIQDPEMEYVIYSLKNKMISKRFINLSSESDRCLVYFFKKEGPTLENLNFLRIYIENYGIYPILKTSIMEDEHIIFYYCIGKFEKIYNTKEFMYKKLICELLFELMSETKSETEVYRDKNSNINFYLDKLKDLVS